MLSYDLFPVAILIVPTWSEIYELQAPDFVRNNHVPALYTRKFLIYKSRVRTFYDSQTVWRLNFRVSISKVFLCVSKKTPALLCIVKSHNK